MKSSICGPGRKPRFVLSLIRHYPGFSLKPPIGPPHFLNTSFFIFFYPCIKNFKTQKFFSKNIFRFFLLIPAKFFLITAKFLLITVKLLCQTEGQAPPQSLIYANLTYLLPLSMHFSTVNHRRKNVLFDAFYPYLILGHQKKATNFLSREIFYTWVVVALNRVPGRSVRKTCSVTPQRLQALVHCAEYSVVLYEKPH